MKEQIHTIPINDALDNAGECLFCYIERRTEEHAMNYVLGHGASYMEADIREMTDKAGFCRTHYKKMFDYGNALGNAWILKTHYRRIIDEMNKEFKDFKPGKPAKKGVCLSHFANLMEGADQYLKPSEQEEFYNRFLPLQSTNMERIYEDIAWFIEKYDYKNKDADWKDSKDAVQRGMMKMKGTDPSLPPYQLKR